MNKILVAKCFGIGNCILSIPLFKALRTTYPDAVLDALIGSTSDDGGSYEVMFYLVKNGVINNLYVDSAPHDYDVAILAIPFDGRWVRGIHFDAKKVMDGRTRPDPKTTGLVSWKKHEIDYMMENAYELGYQGEIPDTSFLTDVTVFPPNKSKQIYLGLGYKKDQAGFWKVKHWGNEKYAQLIRQFSFNAQYGNHQFVTTGDLGDLQHTIKPIQARLKEWGMEDGLKYIPSNLKNSFDVVASCDYYIGNDSGFCHAAASCGNKVVTIFNMENAVIKNHPWTYKRVDLEGWKEPVSVDQVRNAFERLRNNV